MDAIKLLKQQHRLVERLFKELESDDRRKQQTFIAIADNLAVHATIEERHFYPAVRARQTEAEVEEAYDEHIEIKKLLLDAMRSTEEPGWDGKVAALKGAVEHHVEEEENDLFPEVELLLSRDALEAIGQMMEADAEMLKAEGEPRKNVKVEAEPPATQP